MIGENADYEYALREIRRSMHDPRGSKAAVLVGAGFSRNAIATRGSGQRTFPDWAALTTILIGRLYPDRADREKLLSSVGATSSALRLAQEFESAHGRPALIDIVRESVPDDDFAPSVAHEQLMDLNWADVFTTNYDRLLEWATLQRPNQTLRKTRYEICLDSSDLPLARRPRIIKLHGTLPDLANLVLTEDDYRRYPIDHAPLVNAVRASLTENIFCLVGFSGDDPNFLAWTGWIRDVLNRSSPPIYLFGGLPLKPFQRKLLEQRNIIPIPILRISDCERYSDAFAWLFRELAKPLDPPTAAWNTGPNFVSSSANSDSHTSEPSGMAQVDKEAWLGAAVDWRRHRFEYKGWHVLYRSGITQLWRRTEFWLGRLSRKTVEDWEPYERIFVLRELLWRTAHALQPIPDKLVEHVIDFSLEEYVRWRSGRAAEAANQSTSAAVSLDPTELDEAYTYILLELLRHAREIGDALRFDSIKARVETELDGASFGENRSERHFVRHQTALRMLSRFEHDLARAALRKWETNNADDIWTIRRAGLMLECGERALGTMLLTKVLNRVTSMRSGTEIDYPLRSAEGLALHLLWYCSQLEAIGAARGRRPANGKSPPARGSWIGNDESAGELHGVKSTSPSDADVGGTDNDRSALPEESAIRRRLKELGNLGCDPYEILDWLRLQNEERMPPKPADEDRDSYDDLQGSRSFNMGTPNSLLNAYRAIRFIEEAGLPPTIHGALPVNVCQTLFNNAAQTVAVAAPREGIGLALRSHDSKLVEVVLSRSTLAAISEPKIHSLTEVGLAAAHRAREELRLPAGDHHNDSGWWEDQLGLAAEILSRIVVRADDSDAGRVADEAIEIAADETIWARFRVAHRLGSFIRRSIQSLSATTLDRLLPTLLGVPLAAVIPPRHQSAARWWYDPLSALSLRRDISRRPSSQAFDHAVSALFGEIEIATGGRREALVFRAAVLLSAGLLTPQERQGLAAALFAQTDPLGFPTDTGCYDSLILGLPRRRGVSEESMFRKRCIEGIIADDPYWDSLKRTVNRFGPPRGPTSRSIRWNHRDLTAILRSAEDWLPAFARRVAKDRETIAIHGKFVVGITQPGRDAMADAYRNWLATIEDVVLLAPNATGDHISFATRLLALARESGFATIRASATLVCLGQLGHSGAAWSVRNAVSDRDESVVLQACDAIARWSELTRAGRQPAIPATLLTAFGTLIAGRQHEHMPLLLDTARELVEILGELLPDAFIDQILHALELFALETSYGSRVTTFTIGQKIQLRVLCARLAASLSDSGLNNTGIQEWASLVKSDVFSEVRNSLPTKVGSIP
jgi:hypothetical protein